MSSKQIDSNTPYYDAVKRWGQLFIMFSLYIGMMSFLAYYTIFKASDEWQLVFANHMMGMSIMGAGIIVAIFLFSRKQFRKNE